MDEGGSVVAGDDDHGRWGRWRGVCCGADGCESPAVCKGFCASHYNKARWASGHRPASVNPGARRAARIKHRYGIEVDEYEALLVVQDGRCAVCGERPAATDSPAHWAGKLCIDHDHGTGRIRGLLCNDCNLVIGRGATPALLRAAADYLESRS